MDNQDVGSAKLFISSQCPHCEQMIRDLSELLKQGHLSSLHIINLSVDQEQAASLGIRSVPWLQLGEFQLQGSLSMAELNSWLQRQGSVEGRGEYLSRLLQDNQLNRATQLAKQDEKWLTALVRLLDRETIDYKVQLGVSAIFEELQGKTELNIVLPDLEKHINSINSRLRADAAYLLSLLDSDDARKLLQTLLDDKDREVREIARDAFEV